MPRLAIFWAVHALATLVFLGGVWLNASIWLQGSIEGRAPAGLRGAAGAAWRFLRRAGLWRGVRALFLDGLFHRRLLAEDRWRWLAHACLLGSFFALAALSALTGLAQEILIGLFRVRHPLVQAVVNKDTPIMALANETLGLVMLLGVGLVSARRYLRRPAQLRTAPVDTMLIVLLAVTLLTGYPTEMLRLLQERVPANPGWYSYIAYALSLPLRSLGWPWERLHYWTFLFHSLFASAFFAYVPFSKFFHVFASPIVATVNSLAREVQEA